PRNPPPPPLPPVPPPPPPPGTGGLGLLESGGLNPPGPPFPGRVGVAIGCRFLWTSAVRIRGVRRRCSGRMPACETIVAPTRAGNTGLVGGTSGNAAGREPKRSAGGGARAGLPSPPRVIEQP